MKKTKKSKRGLASINKQRGKEIATMGGKALAAKYGSEHMANIGRLGGLKRVERLKKPAL
jgi:general stress protein YciG